MSNPCPPVLCTAILSDHRPPLTLSDKPALTLPRDMKLMTMLSARLSRALRQGRVRQPDTRAELHSLLRMRAAAHATGADELEALLRDQIRWALPIERQP